MERQYQHAQLPRATHDEQALQDFIQSFKLHLARNVVAGNRTVFEKGAQPEFERKHGRPPKNRHDVGEAMADQPYYRMWSALQRVSQDMNWNVAADSVARQLPDLIEVSKSWTDPVGTLTLNPEIEVPRYLSAVDIHCVPGNYHRETVDDDLAQGAIFDRGGYVYSMGGWGPQIDAMGQGVVDHLKATFPDLRPAKILDMGCTIGGSTLPYVDAFPDAEIYAIDVAGPCLRYGHSRAEALGKAVHFVQDNAEHTQFEDESFDLVVSHILMHETSNRAIRNILGECRRLLKPGGITAHVDLAVYRHMDAFDQFMLSWDNYNNNEPFWSAYREMDPAALMREAGFAEDAVFDSLVARKAGQNSAFVKGKNSGGRSFWEIFGAGKAA